MTAVMIKVGASVGADFTQIFRPVIESSKRARAAVDADAKGAARAYEAESAKMLRARQKLVQEELKGFDARVKASAKARAAEERDIMRTAEKAIRAEERIAATQAKARGKQRMAIASEAGRNIMGLARTGARFAGEIARGMGVNFDVSSLVGANVNLSKQATELANAAYLPGQTGAAGKKQDPKAIMAEVKAAADLTGYSREQAMGGLQAFVGKSGNLELGRKVLVDLAKLSKATGSELSDVVSAAGEIGVALEKSTDPGGEMLAIMRALAGQGKLGAVEMSDQAKYLARAAAAGPQFEGSVAKNIETMGILAQLARQRGGAASAAEAFTAVSGFTTTFKKNARRGEFEKAGISIEGKGGMLRDPIAIMKEVIAKTGGDVTAMNKMFMDVRGAKPMEAVANIYRQAGGGKAGERAVAAEFERLAAASMDTAEVERAFGERMKDTDSKAQVFQNKLEDMAGRMMTSVIPAFERLAPSLITVGDAFGKLVSWAAENPGKAITAAIVGSIAKAAIGETIAGSLKALIGGGGAAGGGGLVGALGPILALGAIAGAILGNFAVDQAELRDKVEQKKMKEIGAAGGNVLWKADEKSDVRRAPTYQNVVRDEEGHWKVQESETMMAQTGSLAARFSNIKAGMGLPEQATDTVSSGAALEAIGAKLDALAAASKGALKEGGTINVGNMPPPVPGGPPPPGAGMPVPAAR